MPTTPPQTLAPALPVVRDNSWPPCSAVWCGVAADTDGSRAEAVVSTRMHACNARVPNETKLEG